MTETGEAAGPPENNLRPREPLPRRLNDYEASMRTKTLLMRFLLAPALIVASATGCSNPVDEEHEGPTGLVVLTTSGQVVASYRVNGGATGQIAVSRGIASTFQVVATADDGDRIPIDGSEVGLKVGVAGTGLTATLQGADRVVVTGTQGGQGTLQLTVTHEGHDEFRADLGVTVNP